MVEVRDKKRTCPHCSEASDIAAIFLWEGALLRFHSSMKGVSIIVVAIFSVCSGEISASTAQKLQSIIIPSIEVVEAPIGDVAGLLQSKSSELDSSGFGVNVILDVKPEALEQTVSLRLQNVPLGRLCGFF